MQMNHLIIRIMFSFTLMISSPFAVSAGLILSVDYEDGTFGKVARTNPGWSTNTGYPSLCCSHSAQNVTSPVRVGSRAVKMTLLPTDAGYEYGVFKDPYVRSEFENWQDTTAHVGAERWYGFSVYVDPTYTDTSTDPNGTIVFQWHGSPESCDIVKSPRLLLAVTRDLRWRVRNQSDPNPCTTDITAGRIDFDVGPVTKGVWVDWVVYAKWSYTSTGILKVWKDGSLVVNRTANPNTYNDQNPEIVKWGIYKSWWHVQAPPSPDRLVVYLDEIKIGDASSSYNEVAPKSSQSGSAPPAPGGLTVTVK
jgi:hypothetical protein